MMLTDTAYFRNPNYHARTDTIDTLDFEKMALVIEALAWGCWSFDTQINAHTSPPLYSWNTTDAKASVNKVSVKKLRTRVRNVVTVWSFDPTIFCSCSSHK